VSKTPRGSSTSSAPQRNPWREYVIETGERIKERDENPITVQTIFGTWSSGKGGLGWHTELASPPPVLMPSKRKYRPGL
jgi:hypothetical protein